MVGRRTEWRLLQYVGVVTFVVGFVAYTVLGWRFGRPGDSPSIAVAIFAVAVALVWAFAKYR